MKRERCDDACLLDVVARFLNGSLVRDERRAPFQPLEADSRVFAAYRLHTRRTARLA